MIAKKAQVQKEREMRKEEAELTKKKKLNYKVQEKVAKLERRKDRVTKYSMNDGHPRQLERQEKSIKNLQN